MFSVDLPPMRPLQGEVEKLGGRVEHYLRRYPACTGIKTPQRRNVANGPCRRECGGWCEHAAYGGACPSAKGSPILDSGSRRCVCCGRSRDGPPRRPRRRPRPTRGRETEGCQPRRIYAEGCRV